MPRSSRNRSVSPQKMPAMTSNETSEGESKQMEEDRLYHQIQEMFQGIVDPEVVHLVLTECEWRVDDAIETLFAMSKDKELGEKKRSEVSDLDVIACSLIGDADSKQNIPHTDSQATDRKSMETGQSTSQKSAVTPKQTRDKKDDFSSSDKEYMKEDLPQDMSRSQSEPSEAEGVSYPGLQSYMDMYKIYGGYVPEIMESINLKSEELISGSSDISTITLGGPKLSSVSSNSTASELTEITLSNYSTDGFSGSNRSDGKANTCHADSQRVNTALPGLHTEAKTDTTDYISLYSDSRMVDTVDYWDFKCSDKRRTELSECNTKGDNSDGSLTNENPEQIEKTETDEEDEFLRRKDDTAQDVCENVQAMFSSYKSVQNKLEKDDYHKAGSQIPPANLSPDAPVFVPRLTSPLMVPSGPPPGIRSDHIPHWSAPPPMFMTPKGPRPPRIGLGPNHNPQQSRWQRPNSYLSSQRGQPRPLQPLSGRFSSTQKAFRFTDSGSQGNPPHATSSDHFPSLTGDLSQPRAQQQGSKLSGLSYSGAAAKEPFLVPEWAKMSPLRSAEVETQSEISCKEQVNTVQSYMDQGRLLLVLLRGLPGSGKSYLARQLVGDGVTLSTDDYFYRCGEYNYKQDQLSDAHTWNKDRARDAMNSKRSPVVIDNTNTMEWEMIPYVRLAVARGYEVEVFEPNTPWKFQPKVLSKRNSHGVTRETIRKMNQRYQGNITAAALLAKVAQQQSIQEAKKAKEASPVVQPKSDVNASVKLVEYDSSSDEEGETLNKPKVKKAVRQPPPLPLQSHTLPGAPAVPKLNQDKKQPQKKNGNNNTSAPSSPRKRRRKKRKPSSSRSEVMQTIEEILQCCGEGRQMSEEDWRTREEEIQALLFMSPLSETEKLDIQTWLTEKLDVLKGKGGNTEDFKEGNPDEGIDDSFQAEVCQDLGISCPSTSIMKIESCDSKLLAELDKIVSSDLSEMIERAKSVISAAAERMDSGEINLYKTDIVGEDRDGDNGKVGNTEREDEGNEEDSWSQSQSGPKPKRSRKPRTSQTQEEENMEQMEFNFTRELEYWTRSAAFESEVRAQSSTQSDSVDSILRMEDVFNWEEPKPQRERNDSDRLTSSAGAEVSETEKNLQQEKEEEEITTESEMVMSIVHEILPSKIEENHPLEMQDEEKEDMQVGVQERDLVVDVKLHSGEVVVETSLEEQTHTAFMDVSPVIGYVEDGAEEPQNTPDSVDISEAESTLVETKTSNTDLTSAEEATRVTKTPDTDDDEVERCNDATKMPKTQLDELVIVTEIITPDVAGGEASHMETRTSDNDLIGTEENNEVTKTSETEDDVETENKVVEKRDKEVDKDLIDGSEEEFRSFDSDDAQTDVKEIQDGSPEDMPVLGVSGPLVDAEDSFLSVLSSRDGDCSPQKSDLSFVSEDGEPDEVDKLVKAFGDHVDSSKDHILLDVEKISELNPNQIESQETYLPSELCVDFDKDITKEPNQTDLVICNVDNVNNSLKESPEQQTDAKESILESEIVEPIVPNITESSNSAFEEVVINEESSPQKSSTPKKSKAAKKKQGSAFLDDEVKQKFETSNWSTFDIKSKVNLSESKRDSFKNIQPKSRRSLVRSVYSFTRWQDFTFLTELNSSKNLSQIKNSNKYKILLGKSRDINIEMALRRKQHSSSPESESDIKKQKELTLEKGCMTEESDLQVDDVEFLVNTFPEADEEHLRETLDMCQGSVEWTLNLLLDWGASEPFSSIEKEEISNEMKLKTPERKKENSDLRQSRSPLSLFDMCRVSIEENNLTDNDDIQKKVISTGLLRLERMESHSYMRAHSLSMSESNIGQSGNESILEDLITSSSLASSDVYVSPDKESSVAENGASAPSSQGKQLFSNDSATDQENAFSAESDWQVEDDWSDNERSMIDGDAHVMLPVPIELVRDLEELFGPVQPSLSDCEAFEVTLDLLTAKRLFDNLRMKPASRVAMERRREEAKEALQKQLQDDEAMARRLQEEENISRGQQQSRQDPSQILREAKSAALSDFTEPAQYLHQGTGSSFITIGRNTHRKKQARNLVDIMEEERANQQRREEQDLLLCSHGPSQQKVLDATGDRVAISTKLKRQKLYNHFPGVDENFLEEIFEANGFSLEDTVRVMQEAVGRGGGASPVNRKRLIQETEEKQLADAKRRNLQDLVDQSWKTQETKAIYQSWDTPGVLEYDDIRGEANIHHKLRNECFQKAQEAFRRNMRDVAAFYSQQGHMHTHKLKEANKRASLKILEDRNDGLQQGTLDLHGFHVDEAIHILNKVMKEREEEFQIRPDKRKQSLFVITGRGRHSKGGVAKLRPAIINHLNNVGYRYEEQQPGLFRIQLRYRP